MEEEEQKRHMEVRKKTYTRAASEDDASHIGVIVLLLQAIY
tara:strand:- start:307 stop:429 length:123 start_codon:yes stop_codon:yes gene_type:complete